jgi:hypothetical protein
MMGEREIRQLQSLKQALDQPHFDEAVDELRRQLADEIADCLDPVKADALRAERIALARLRGRLQAHLNKLTMEKLDAA